MLPNDPGYYDQPCFAHTKAWRERESRPRLPLSDNLRPRVQLLTEIGKAMVKSRSLAELDAAFTTLVNLEPSNALLDMAARKHDELAAALRVTDHGI
jgi:hypothetical protein